VGAVIGVTVREFGMVIGVVVSHDPSVRGQGQAGNLAQALWQAPFQFRLRGEERGANNRTGLHGVVLARAVTRVSSMGFLTVGTQAIAPRRSRWLAIVHRHVHRAS